MTLESGDRLFFDITPTGMVLQMFDDCNKEEVDPDGPNHVVYDTVILHGCEVARLMWALRQAGQGVVPTYKIIVHEKLTVSYEDGLLLLHTGENTCVLERHEMYMVLCALSTRAWRLFQ